MSIMFLEGAYPSPGEAHQGRLQLVEVSLHTQVKCSDSAGKDKISCRQRDGCFELSILGAAGLFHPCKGERLQQHGCGGWAGCSGAYASCQ